MDATSGQRQYKDQPGSGQHFWQVLDDLSGGGGADLRAKVGRAQLHAGTMVQLSTRALGGRRFRYKYVGSDPMVRGLDGEDMFDETPTQAIVIDLRREPMHVEPALLDIFDAPPAMSVYVVSMDPAMQSTLAPRFVAWAATGDVQAGLIGLIESGTTHDSEELLAAGFDDALATPMSSRELVARVRAVHRRVHWKGTTNGRLRFGDLTLDLYGRELWLDGVTVSLTSVELAVVRELMKAQGRPLSRTELLDLAWGAGDLEVSERAVDNVILRLRRKLPRPDLLETVRSVGFRLAAVSRSGR